MDLNIESKLCCYYFKLFNVFYLFGKLYLGSVYFNDFNNFVLDGFRIYVDSMDK